MHAATVVKQHASAQPLLFRLLMGEQPRWRWRPFSLRGIRQRRLQ